MVLDRAVLDVWRRGFLDTIQFDAHAIGAVIKFRDAITTPANVKFNSNDYLTHVSKKIGDSVAPGGAMAYLGIAEFYREIIVKDPAMLLLQRISIK